MRPKLKNSLRITRWLPQMIKNKKKGRLRLWPPLKPTSLTLDKRLRLWPLKSPLTLDKNCKVSLKRVPPNQHKDSVYFPLSQTKMSPTPAASFPPIKSKISPTPAVVSSPPTIKTLMSSKLTHLETCSASLMLSRKKKN